MTGNGSTISGTTPGVGRAGWPPGPMVPAERGHELLADGVERRVGDLGEELAEVVEQQPRRSLSAAIGCRCPSSRSARPGVGHRGEEDPQLLLGVAEDLLARVTEARGGCTMCSRSGMSSRRIRPAVQPRPAVGVPAASCALISSSSMIRCSSVSTRNIRPAAGGPCGPRWPGRGRARRLGGEHHEAVVGDPVAEGRRPLRSRRRRSAVPSEKHDAGRAVPRLHHREWNCRTRAAWVHLGRGSPTPRDHHQHRVRQAATTRRGGARGPRRRTPSPRRRGADREEPPQVAGDDVESSRARGPASSCGCP